MHEDFYSNRGININKEQLENLHLGKPIPWYDIVNEKLEPANPFRASLMAVGESLSLRFTNAWNVPVMSAGEPLFFGIINFSTINRAPSLADVGFINTIEHFHNYEHKDSIIGSVGVNIKYMGMDFLIIRKEHKDVFVEVYDKATGEYFKNEYGSDELITLLIDLAAKAKDAQSRYYAFVADKSELILTPEITEMLVNQAYSSLVGYSDENLLHFGITNRAQLEHLHLGKPVPKYIIRNENLTFTGAWSIPVMSNGDPLNYSTSVKLEDNGQYRLTSGGSSNFEVLNNYEYKDLIIGILSTDRASYLIIRRNNTDIFVEMYDRETHEYFVNEYSLSEIINLFKK
jgi:hypothetical protein